MPWQVIQYVTTGFTLCAFIAALISSVLKRQIEQKRLLIQSAKEQDRAALVSKTLEFFDVDTKLLSENRKRPVVTVCTKSE
jgi:hypothetical protein